MSYEKKNYIVGLVALAVAIVISVPGVYWGYMCRYFGELCEGSVVSVSPEVGKKNEAIVNKEYNNIRSIDFVTRKSWPFLNRIDVVARLKDNLELTINSLKITEDDIIAKFADDNAVVAIIAYISDISIGNRIIYRLNIEHFHFNKSVINRIITIDCNTHYAYIRPIFDVSNISYSMVENRIVFDLKSNCNNLKIDNKHSFQFLRYGEAQYNISDGISGARIDIKLSDEYYLDKFVDEDEENTTLARNQMLMYCVEQVAKNASAQPHTSKLELCKSSTYSKGIDTYSYKVLAVIRGEAVTIAYQGCIGNVHFDFNENLERNLIITVCNGTHFNVYDITSSFADINVYRLDAKHIEIPIHCNCSTLGIKDVEYDINEGALKFSIKTDSDSVTISETNYPLDRGAEHLFIGTVQLSLDDKNQISSFSSQKKASI